ncbi:PoNe immunity protein domain-containing protein [Massilia antarctica]|uniref:PoNe immunity protein domain-containing protein n=1 Tax=Massilia antarctica TaxID=2765360 RepID=UPI0006BB6069|nr:PoNe immunity protein domain-containing protein [Massilia sp. H27-R4]MCY0914598.1 DUF1911 domain-containing protein [Massilia sp. H27-R4]CUI03007.1 Putative transmembrane protein [Janthinobacterium sp. CG23_2]CUU26793.1 Putative transmembrane protein [Janthinobacterium sp. CG23_2]
MTTPRNLGSTPCEMDVHVNDADGKVAWLLRRYAEEPEDPYNQYNLLTIPRHQQKCLLYRFARGDTLGSIRAWFLGEMLPTLRTTQEMCKALFPEHDVLVNAGEPWALLWLFAFVCFDEDGTELARAHTWFERKDGPVLFDMLLKAFVPSTAYARKYNPKSSRPQEESVIDALLLDEAARGRALEACMRQWPKLMKPYGYREAPLEGKHLFEHFPFEIALAVCACDADDSALRDLPYYPRELVDYYRSHVRAKRDAWRGTGVGAGPEIPPAPHRQPKKVYSLKPAEAYVRWLELACNEQPEMIAKAHKGLKKRKSMPALCSAMEVLAGLGCGAQADLKDDATLADYVVAMCAARGLPAFTPPPPPPEGPARIGQILLALQAWSVGQGQQLFVLTDDEDDNWNALLVRADAKDEFALLCEQLSLEVLDEAGWS